MGSSPRLQLQHILPLYKSQVPSMIIQTTNIHKMKQVIVLAFLVVFIVGVYKVNGSGECGRVSPDREAFKLMPCAMAAQDENAPVSDRCCAVIKQLGQNPSCLCAVMMSNTARSAGAKPEVSITIPKRCNLADRPVGYKCGAYTLP